MRDLHSHNYFSIASTDPTSKILSGVHDERDALLTVSDLFHYPEEYIEVLPLHSIESDKMQHSMPCLLRSEMLPLGASNYIFLECEEIVRCQGILTIQIPFITPMGDENQL